MPILTALREFLETNKAPYSVHSHPQAFTAQEIAALEHVAGRRLAKVVMVKAGDQLIMLVIPADHRIDFERIKALLGRDVRLATEQDVATESGAWAHVAISYDDAARELRCAVNGLSKTALGPAGWARTLSPVRIGSLTSGAAFDVGYQSPSQFSREYARKFGVPPRRDLGDHSHER